jgi:hypothetical protein
MPGWAWVMLAVMALVVLIAKADRLATGIGQLARLVCPPKSFKPYREEPMPTEVREAYERYLEVNRKLRDQRPEGTA